MRSASHEDMSMKNAAIVVVYTLLFCVYVHAQARVEEHDSQEIAAIVSALVGEMVSIPGGSFRMGDLSGEGSDDEKPVRIVTVPAFKLGKYEVTFAQWDACLADGGCNGYSPHDFGWGRDDRPVIDISWDAVQSFIDWLNTVTGGNYRLPSEAEWEYAARAGSTTEYSWGDDIGNNRANCDGCGSQWDNDRTAPVGSFPANAWGLHDMHGNVAEWVQDCPNDSYEGAPTDGSAWTSGDCDWRVLRGGIWHSKPWTLRSATRNWKDHWDSYDVLGFRLAQSPPAVPSQTSATAQPQIRPEALHYAARYAVRAGDIEMLKAAIAAGADVNARDGHGWTALMYAVDNGYVLLVSQLLKAQADVNVRAPEGVTASFMAVADGRTEIIELLMKAGADVSIRGLTGTTPGEVEEERAQVEPTVKQLVGEMVPIPAGSFNIWGLRGDDDDKYSVRVSAFELGKHEVTVGQFRAFVVATGYRTDAERNSGGNEGCFISDAIGASTQNFSWTPGSSWRNPGYAVADDQPVVCVSWNDVQAFIIWLNDRTGGNFRLPSEAEWDYVSRVGSKYKYNWEEDNKTICYDGEAEEYYSYDELEFEQSAPVESSYDNDYVICDVFGDVTEWEQDCWNDNYEGVPKDGSAWTSGDCSLRSVRNGAWISGPLGLRIPDRSWNARLDRDYWRGFRLAQSAPAAPSQASVAAQPQIRSNALHNAAMAGDIEMLKAAITAGVDVNARDGRSRTALMYVVDNGYVLLVSQLLEAQADVDMRAADGATALFMAAANGHTEIIELLMKAGAEVSIRGPKGATPTDVARERYGDANAARATGKPEAVLALLDGKTWMEVEQDLEEARAQVEPRVRQLADEMISIPAGSFDMGDLSHDSSDDECLVYEEPVNQVMNVSLMSASQTTSIPDLEVLFSSYDCYDWPVHRVTVPAFKLGKHEVTVSQFRAFVVATGYRTDAERNAGGEEGCNISNADDDWSWTPGSSWFSPGFVVSDDQPVVCVSWNDAQAFIDWLNGKVGGNYRLPSEAEWEYAARSGTTTKYSWGDDIGQNRARCKGCGVVSHNQRPAPVGSFSANAWGLHDMHGNASEWVQDCWNDNYKGAPKDGSAWKSGNCNLRTYRGGSWDDEYPSYLRSAYRSWSARSDRSSNIGFRLAQDE